jgi:hypothetical protein
MWSRGGLFARSCKRTSSRILWLYERLPALSRDILAAMENIEEFIFGMDLGTFQADEKTASASLRKLEILGQ